MKRSQRNARAGPGYEWEGDDDEDYEEDGRKPQRQSTRRSKVDFAKCEVSSLHKYRKYFKLEGSPNTSKDELIAIIAKHFVSQPTPSDEDAIAAFLLCFKRLKRDPTRMHTAAKRGRGGGGPKSLW